MMLKQTDSTCVAVRKRWLIRKDVQQVLAIEWGCFEYPWNETDFVRVLRRSDCLAFVAVDSATDRVSGYAVYALNRTKLEILTLAVAPWRQREGVGRAMVGWLIDKLHGHRNRITATVRESNVDAQCFFRAMGFHATAIIKRPWSDTEENGYSFTFRKS